MRENRGMVLRLSSRALVCAALAGSAAGQEAVAGFAAGEPVRVHTSFGALEVEITAPLGTRALARVRDRSPGKAPTPTEAVTLTSRVYAKLDVRARRELELAGFAATDLDAGFVAIEAGSVARAAELADALAGTPGVELAEVEALRPLTTRTPLNDALYSLAWHLFNEDAEGNDVNAEAAWKMGYTGSGVAIGIIDGGLWNNHPELLGKFIPEASQTGPSSAHGMGVAGVALAQGNNAQGTAGLAYNARFANLYFSPPGDASVNAAAFAMRNDLLDIKNNSWGPADNGQLRTMSQLEQDTILEAVTSGRDGRGTIFVWAAGNGGTADRVDYDPYAASPYTIAIGAIHDQARRASYSERGASLFAVTYSSGSAGNRNIVTLRNLAADPYNLNFGGTSAASPLAAGAIALCLEANPELTWRDVQHLIVRAAEPVDTSDADWTTNGAGIPINHNYGFGQLDAALMLEQALAWTPVAPLVTLGGGEIATPMAIPDNDPAGIVLAFDVAGDLTIEHVSLDLNVTGTFIGDLEVVLTSPMGTSSVLHTLHGNSADVMDHTFHSVRHWDESARGTWTLRVADLSDQDLHTFQSASLRFMGTEPVRCVADQNGDGSLTPEDFQAWVTNFTARDPIADTNGDGAVTPADFSAWIIAYNVGC